MARGKNAPALFEVIRNAQEKQRQVDQRRQDQKQREETAQAALSALRVPGAPRVPATATATPSSAAALLRSPLFWFKGRAAHDEAGGDSTGETAVQPRRAIEPVMREVSPAVIPVRNETVSAETIQPAIDSDAFRRALDARPADDTSEPAAPAAAPAPAYRPAVAEYARQVREEIAAQDAPAAEPFFGSRPAGYAETTHTDPAAAESDRSNPNYPGSNRPEFAIDRDRRQISMRVSYTTAIVAGFAVVVACGLAYIVGSAGHGKTVAVANSTPQPGVLNVQQNSANLINDPANVTHQNATDLGKINDTGKDLSLDNGGGPIDVPTNVKRIVGYQYLVLMSFQRGADANALVKFLADNGVPATAEKALPGYSAAWYSVVTTHGFDHTSKNPPYDVFVASLTRLMQKYSRSSQYVAGKPAVYTWHTAG